MHPQQPDGQDHHSILQAWYETTNNVARFVGVRLCTIDSHRIYMHRNRIVGIKRCHVPVIKGGS